MNIAVIIPSRTIDNLLPCVDAIRASGEDLPVFYVDDGLDFSFAMRTTAGRLARTVRVAGEKPFIFARNVNIGIRAAGRRDGYIVLNDDALLKTPGGFTRMAQDVAAHPEIGLMGVTTNVTGLIEQLPGGSGTFREVPRTFPFVGVYIPQSTIDRVGYLDERYAIDYGCEDNDYCEAVRRAGLKLAVHDGCFVDHASLVSTFRGSPDTPKSFEKNYALFQAKCEHCDRTGEPFVAGAGLTRECATLTA